MDAECKFDAYDRPAPGTQITIIRTHGGLYVILEYRWWEKVSAFQRGGVPVLPAPSWSPLGRLSAYRSKGSGQGETSATRVTLNGTSNIELGDSIFLEGEVPHNWAVTTPVLDVIQGEVAAKLTPENVHIVYHPYAAWRISGDDTNAAIPLLKLGDDGPPEQVNIREVTADSGTIVRINESN